MQQNIKVSGLEITPFQSMDEAIDYVFNDGSLIPGFALAINAEKVMSSRSNPKVLKILQMATLRYADGVGVVWALRRKGIVSSKIPGCELWEKVMVEAGKHGNSVFLVGALPNVIEKTVSKLINEINVNIVGFHDGYFEDDGDLINRIIELRPEIVTVAMGSPRQEKFISKCRSQHPEAFYMGVGGTYDVYVGNVNRAPKWALKYNVEWLYRLLQNPRRIRRQLVLIPFLTLMVFNKL